MVMLSQACFERLSLSKRHNALLLCMGEQQLHCSSSGGAHHPHGPAHHHPSQHPSAPPHTSHTAINSALLLAHASCTHMLYQAVSDDLKQRLPLFGPLRLAPGATRQLGVLDAPLGCVTVVFVHMVGAASLLAWDKVRLFGAGVIPRRPY